MKPCRRAETEPARSSASSTSITSARRTLCTPSWAMWAASSPALRGLTANTAECIFTPAGMPSTGTRSPIARRTSTAVPSPPANRSRSTPRSAIAWAAARVSWADVTAAGRADDGGGRAGRRRPPARPSRRRRPAPRGRSRVPRAARSASVARAGAIGRLAALARCRDERDVVAALEREAAAHAGDRVDEEPQSHVTAREGAACTTPQNSRSPLRSALVESADSIPGRRGPVRRPPGS